MEITLYINDEEYQLLQKIATKMSEQVSVCEISAEAVATTILTTNLNDFAKRHLEESMTEREKRLALLTEVEKDPLALELLRHKCVWMQMSWLAVLRDFGDPRTWSSYKMAADNAAKNRKDG